MPDQPGSHFSPAIHQAERVLCARFGVPSHHPPVLLALAASGVGVSLAVMAEQVLNESDRRPASGGGAAHVCLTAPPAPRRPNVTTS